VPIALDLSEVEDEHVSAVTRLVTFVDLAEGVGDARQVTFSARHEAVLSDGRSVLLLDDRGWTFSSPIALQAGDAPHRGARREQQPDFWATTSGKELEETARMVVGPR
jgi:hypothetical protein